MNALFLISKILALFLSISTLSAESLYIAGTNSDNHATVWQMSKAGNEEYVYHLSNVVSYTTCIKQGPDGSIWVTGSRGGPGIWKINSSDKTSQFITLPSNHEDTSIDVDFYQGNVHIIGRDTYWIYDGINVTEKNLSAFTPVYETLYISSYIVKQQQKYKQAYKLLIDDNTAYILGIGNDPGSGYTNNSTPNLLLCKLDLTTPDGTPVFESLDYNIKVDNYSSGQNFLYDTTVSFKIKKDSSGLIHILGGINQENYSPSHWIRYLDSSYVKKSYYFDDYSVAGATSCFAIVADHLYIGGVSYLGRNQIIDATFNSDTKKVSQTLPTFIKGFGNMTDMCYSTDNNLLYATGHSFHRGGYYGYARRSYLPQSYVMNDPLNGPYSNPYGYDSFGSPVLIFDPIKKTAKKFYVMNSYELSGLIIR